ncbi:phage shock protein C (PspC) family protein [Leucobacter komagatae]|uniref:Phage shock protein C (PspC) family protein n=1 Tax=Leucobacter komagatae TaxID=55969 RepID=A0A542Y6B1_9MICO|nr:ATP-binding protein [Leucobacter komagatae]TQL43632.1 phage shock protein C (PspC) family protein [Leucobacter komagatae]
MSYSTPPKRMLVRSESDRLLAGVCGGLAEHLGVPVMAVRIGMLILTLAGGAGAIFYLWLWGTVPLGGAADTVAPMRRALTRDAATLGKAGVAQPRSPQSAPASQPPQAPAAPLAQATPQGQQAPLAQAATANAAAPVPVAEAMPVPGPAGPAGPPARSLTRWPIAELLLGACLLVVGALLVVQRMGVELQLSLILPGLAVLVGVGLTWWQIADRNRPESNPVPRVLGALSLVAVGVLMFFVTSESPNVWTVMAAALAALAGVALAIAPWLLRLNRELIAERAGREREAERSEIAAHLHDSVLQTLALIQQRSAPGSEVARIARGQERELREWLFRAADGGVTAPKETALEELRAHAAGLEDAHAVRFEIVGVGAEVVVPEPIVAAAREAMLNAAQHAGGEVTVYAEVSPTRVSIDVTDRGPGLDPEHLPEGRMGVRDSILGRMARAGGTAKIVPGPGGNGTSVRLEMPRENRTDTAADAGTGATP